MAVTLIDKPRMSGSTGYNIYTENTEYTEYSKYSEYTEENTVLENGMNSYWQQRSSSYSEQNMAQLFSEKRYAWENLIFGHGNETKNMDILDIGTGPGFFAILSAMRGHNVTAADMSADMLEQARKNAELTGTDINFLQVGRMLPFEDESFDLIISRDVTWTLTEPEVQLRHWANKLKKGGTMLYFDAEWYYYLKNSEYRYSWEENRKKIIEGGGFIYSKAAKLESLAVNLPMTYKNRPVWDSQYWAGQKGFTFELYENLNSYVYNEKEQMQYELFPEFLAVVRRVL